MSDLAGRNVWLRCSSIEPSYAPGELYCRFEVRGELEAHETGVSVPHSYVDVESQLLRVYAMDSDPRRLLLLVDFNRECDNGSMRNWVALRDVASEPEPPVRSALDEYLSSLD
jgi:hypothetical protein